jgi:hypothetical protein
LKRTGGARPLLWRYIKRKKKLQKTEKKEEKEKENKQTGAKQLQSG